MRNNVDLNVSASPSSVAGINANIDINESVSYGNEAINVDTHIEIDINGNECMVNSVGVTIKTKINGIWYDQDNLPQVTTVASQMPAQRSNSMAAPSRKPITPPSYSSSTSTSTPSTTTTPTSTRTASTTTTTTPTTSTTSTPTPSGFISGEGVYGISWDPFKGTDQSCKTPSEIIADITQLVSYGYSNIRLYGVECDAINYALTAVQGTQTNLILGVYNTDNYTAETADLIAQVDSRSPPLSASHLSPLKHYHFLNDINRLLDGPTLNMSPYSTRQSMTVAPQSNK